VFFLSMKITNTHGLIEYLHLLAMCPTNRHNYEMAVLV